MCDCLAFPVEHNAGWCAMPTQAPSSADWRTFELFTLGDWRNHA